MERCRRQQHGQQRMVQDLAGAETRARSTRGVLGSTYDRSVEEQPGPKERVGTDEEMKTASEDGKGGEGCRGRQAKYERMRAEAQRQLQVELTLLGVQQGRQRPIQVPDGTGRGKQRPLGTPGTGFLRDAATGSEAGRGADVSGANDMSLGGSYGGNWATAGGWGNDLARSNSNFNP